MTTLRKIRTIKAGPIVPVLWCRCTHGDDEHTRGTDGCTHLLYFKGRRSVCPCKTFVDGSVPVFNPVLPPPMVPQVLAKLQPLAVRDKFTPSRVAQPPAAAPVSVARPKTVQGERMSTAELLKAIKVHTAIGDTWTCPECRKKVMSKGKFAHVAGHTGAFKGTHRRLSTPLIGAAAHHNQRRGYKAGSYSAWPMTFKVVERPVTSERSDDAWLKLVDAVAATAKNGKAIDFPTTSPKRAHSVASSLRYALEKRGLGMRYRMVSRTRARAWADRPRRRK